MEQRQDINPRNIKRVKTNASHKASSESLLDTLESKLKEQQKIVQLGKNALRNPDPPYVDIMVDTMLSIFELECSTPEEDEEGMSKPRGTPDANARKTEFEVRIGQIQGKNFQPGILKKDFEEYKGQLEADPEMKCDVSTTMLYYYDLPTNDGNTRIEVDSNNNNVPLRSQTKKRLKVHDIEISVLPYAVRFSIASETEQTAPVTVPNDHKLIRYKTRWSFYKPEAHFSWHIDLTEVRTVLNGDDHETVTYEIEFDFNEDVIDACRRMDKSLVRNISAHFWDFAVRLLNLLHKSGSSHFDPSIRTEKITDEETLRNLRETALNFIVRDAHYTDEFPGSMPVNFSKQVISVVQRHNYYVSEKTDGIRAMLVINPHDAVYLVDRKFDFYAVPDFECLLDIYSPMGVTVLDGELITHLGDNRIMYLIFDVTAVNGKDFYSLPLNKRIEQIQKVVQKYRAAVDENKIPRDHPFVLIGKPLYDKSQMHTLLSFIKEDPVYGRVFNDGRARYHKTDGIIFTPDEPYKTRTVRNLYKFKYADEMSIDLKVGISRSTGNLTFTCVGEKGIDYEYNISLFPEDYNRLFRYATHTLKDQKSPVIVELVYDAVAQKWKLKMIRTDKNRANFIRVVNDTWEVIKENMGIEDLKMYFPPKPRHH